jgi:hypothetical protein
MEGRARCKGRKLESDMPMMISVVPCCKEGSDSEGAKADRVVGAGRHTRLVHGESKRWAVTSNQAWLIYVWCVVA